MRDDEPAHRRMGRRRAFVLAALLAAAPGAAWAQDSDGVTERLIQILVKNGVLKKDQAESLLAQAKADARAGKAAAGKAGATASDKPVTRGSVRVTYVPETVRQQIAAEVKQQVLQQAQDQGWAEPNVIPEWTQRLRFYGDLRLRGEWDLFPRGNSPYLPDFNSINNSSNGFDTNSTGEPPLLNTTDNRTRVRLRARLGVEARIADWATADIRIATGDSSSPVSTNQTLGQPGDFQKYSLWLDQAYIAMKPISLVKGFVGRMPNPFFTTDLMYDEDLNFDGFALTSAFDLTNRVSGFLTAGGFPVFNTSFNLGTTNVQKTKSRDSWLGAIQGGASWRPVDHYKATLAAGYFAFANVEGKESELCSAPTTYGSCNTDNTKAPFIQFGNTVFPVRNINTTNGSTANPEYYGLASRFDVLDVHAQGAYFGFHPTDVLVDADVVDNLGFDRNAITRKSPSNNLNNDNTHYQGGNIGWMIRLTVGHPEMKQKWDWNVALAYKYLESDAVLDALTDSKFHLGGTNAKGYVLTGNLALARDLWLTGRIYSTNEISGPPYSVDSFMVDLNARF